MGRANPENEITRLQSELTRAHETIARLNRRCQSAERGLAAKLNPGPRTFGRILANSAASMWHAWALDMARGILAKEISTDVIYQAHQIVNETAGQSHADMTRELFNLRLELGLDISTGLPITPEVTA